MIFSWWWACTESALNAAVIFHLPYALKWTLCLRLSVLCITSNQTYYINQCCYAKSTFNFSVVQSLQFALLWLRGYHTMSGGVGSPSSVRSYTQKVVGGSNHDLGDVDSMEEDTGSYHSAESPASSAQGAHATTPRYNQSPKASVTSIFKAKELFHVHTCVSYLLKTVRSSRPAQNLRKSNLKQEFTKLLTLLKSLK